MNKEKDWKIDMTACKLRDYAKMIADNSRKQTLIEVRDKYRHDMMGYLSKGKINKFEDWLDKKLEFKASKY